MNFILSKIHWLKSKVFRSAEQEVIEFHEQLSDLSMQNQSLAAAKRKLEQEADNLKQDAEDMRGTFNINSLFSIVSIRLIIIMYIYKIFRYFGI